MGNYPFDSFNILIIGELIGITDVNVSLITKVI